MAASYTTPSSRWRSSGGLLAIAALHLAVVYWWPGRTRHIDLAAQQPMLMWLLRPAALPAPTPAGPLPLVPVPVPVAASAPVAKAALPRGALPKEQPRPAAVYVTPVPVISATPNPAPENSPVPAKPTVDPITGAGLPRLSYAEVAKIAEELHKQAPPNVQVQKYERKESRLALGIAGAYRGDNGGETTEQIDLGDGRFMTKVRGPLGTYCVYKETMAVSGGRDQIQSGVRTKVTTCPR